MIQAVQVDAGESSLIIVLLVPKS